MSVFALAVIGVALAACKGSTDPATGNAAPTAWGPRDLGTLKTIAQMPKACASTAECPSGSHCDADTNTCTWECLSDSDCGRMSACSALGTCVFPVIKTPPEDTATACAGVSASDRDTALQAMRATGGERRCAIGDDNCPCGSYCNVHGFCEADCIAETSPPSGFSCISSVCTPQGRCAATSDAPPPSPEAFTLQISPTSITANTVAGPVLVPVTVTATATSQDFIRPSDRSQTTFTDNDLLVLYRFEGLSETGTPPPGSPLVKCSSDGTLQASCALAGGWQFDLSNGNVVSATRTVWVQIPQASTPTSWTLEARSEWALTPGTAPVTAAPQTFSSDGTGHYTGVLTWNNASGQADVPLPVTAIATASNVAVFEPTKLMLPDGHAIFSRDPSKVTLLGWLNSSTTRYDVRFEWTFAYSASTGQLTGTGNLVTGTGLKTPITLTLQQDGGTGVAACSSNTCGTGNYCDSVMSLCLPGSGSPAGAGIVSTGSGTPTANLPSDQRAAWFSAVASATASSPGLLGGATERNNFERAYCFQSSLQGGPATFAHGGTLLAPSLDLACNVNGGPDTPQTTFPMANRQTEVDVDDQTTTFNLFNACTAELDAQPTGAATTANLMPANPKCVSLGRFFAALAAPATSDLNIRFKQQILRQWLQTNSYAASATVQNQQFEDILGATGLPPQVLLGQAVDRMDRGVALMLDSQVTQYYSASSSIVASDLTTPDYRFFPRPQVHWAEDQDLSTFFPTWPNVESADGNPTLQLGFDFTTTVSSSNPFVGIAGTAPHNSFSIAFAWRSNNPTSNGEVMRFFDSSSNKFAIFSLTPVSGSSTLVNVKFVVDGGSTELDFNSVSISADPGIGVGFVALVDNGGTYSLFQALPGLAVATYHPSTVKGNLTLADTLAPRTATFSCIICDEISFWNRALLIDDFSDMATRYNFNVANHSLPDIPGPPVPGNDQAVGIPVHLLEAADANLSLLNAYIEAERNVSYTECLAGGHSELDVMLNRVGHNLRTIAVVQDQAARSASLAGSNAAWLPRYQADLQELIGHRTKLLSAVQDAQQCRNPLGVAEDDLPLFRGVAGTDAVDRFFASSLFLKGQAQAEVAQAATLITAARTAYNEAQQSQFQETQGNQNTADRILNINVDYEDRLKTYCGTPAGEDVEHQVFPLLAGFQSGAVTSTNCFIKTELPRCQHMESVSVAGIPSECLRGQMGSQILAIQAANIDADNADHAHDRAVEQLVSDLTYCINLSNSLKDDEELLAKHNETVNALLREKNATKTGLLGFVRSVASGFVTGGPLGAFNGGLNFVLDRDSAVSDRITVADEKYQLEITEAKDAETVDDCLHKVADEKFAVDAAVDTMVRAAHDTQAAVAAFIDAQNTVTGIASQGAGQLGIESTINRTPPHLHYWLDQQISAYNFHMAEARRLTYLAVRAFEYEQQQSTGLRSAVLSATLPEQLTEVLTPLGDAISEFDQHHPVDQTPIVLSLRDELLGIADRSDTSRQLSGMPAQSPTSRFQTLLNSEASKIYDATGRYVGRGIHFSIRPDESMANSCNERVWRITPSVQVELAQDISHPNIVLAYANAFGSQKCGAGPGTVEMARVQPSDALLVDGSVIALPQPKPFATTNLLPVVNMSRNNLRGLTFQADDPSAFAGRGLYGDYVVIFPDQPGQCTDSLCEGYSQDVLSQIQDVLVRFDVVEENNSNL